MNKKTRNIILASAILISSAGFGIFFLNKGEAEQTGTSKEKAESSQVAESPKDYFENINGLEYEVKMQEVISLKDKKTHGVVLDIVSSTPFSKEELTALESEVFKLAQSKSKQKISGVIIHIFDSNDNYESEKKNGYKGGNGLVATVSGDHSNETPTVKTTHYQELKVPALSESSGEEDEGNIDVFEYNVTKATVNGDKATMDISVSGSSNEISEFIIGFVQVTRDLNSSIKTYKLNIYQNDSSTPKWKYDGQMLTYEELLTVTNKKPA